MKHVESRSRIFEGYRAFALWAFTLLFLILTLTLSLWLEVRSATNELDVRGEQIHRSLTQRISSLETVLTSLVGLYHASDFLSLAERTSFSQDMLKAYPFITSIMHLSRLTKEHRGEFEADMREQGFVGFRLEQGDTPVTDKARNLGYHLPVSFIEPMDPRSAGMLGYDITRRPGIQQALRHSIGTGEIITVGPIRSDSFASPFYYILKPVYLGRYPPENAAERANLFDGMAALAVQPEKLLAGLVDNGTSHQASLQHLSKESVQQQEQPDDSLYALRYEREISVYGARFRLSLNKMLSAEDFNWQAVLAVWMLSFLTFTLALSVYRNKRKAKLQEEEANAAIAAEDARFSHVIRTAFDAVITADVNCTILSWNRQAAEVFGHNEGEVLGSHLFRLILPPRSLEKSTHALAPLIQETGELPKGLRLELEGKDKNNRIFPLDLSISCSRIGELFTLSVFARDITERKKWDEKIRLLAYNDPLTQLPNRQAFKEQVSRAIKLAKQHNQIGAVLYLDLDEFKRINDILGHDIGDMLLTRVTKNLESHLRDNDLVYRTSKDQDAEDNRNVARLGGDEFTVLLEGIQNPEVAGAVANRVKEAIACSYNLRGHEVYITPSIGIAIFPKDGNDVEELLKNADTAMYHAKSVGKNNYQFYSEQMNAQASLRLKLESKLRNAIKTSEITLFYQPQIDLASGKIVSAEALLRWNQPELGMVSPAEFIPIAEETGMILELGEWVLHEACRQNRAWQDAGVDPIRIAVNLSGIQFMQHDLDNVVSSALAYSRLNPQHLELEITESIIMRKVNDTIASLSRFKEMGISISVDDFGTGYSSLSYLKRLPLDTLKVDRTFVKDIPHSEHDVTIASAIIAMAKSLGLGVVAEGVETDDQLQFLRRQGCDKVQGYFFSEPVPADKLAAMLFSQEN
jgi:diguanylate cyclase (GGDEF)-like protein/PAS domain S-box-containing protein